MVTLKNNKLQIKILKTGAELCEISSTKHGTQFMWNANPDIWGNYAPNLFPIVGMLKDECYFFEGQTYQLSKHGFIRNNTNFQIIEELNESVTLKLNFDEDTLKHYPFKFEFYITYRLIDNKIHISYKVRNVDSQPLYFSVGGHPAFKCPVFADESYTDYQLIFDKEETSKTHLLNVKSGLVTSETRAVFDSSTTINLRYNLFDQDALIFKDLKSRKVSLNSKTYGDILTIHFEEFPFLGLWAKPNADYVCIEPWIGIADHEDTNQQFIDKEAIITLDVNTDFKATYTIEIHKSQLV